MLASSREGEEDAFAQAMLALKASHERHALNAHVLVVPRHPQRFDAVHSALQQRGLRVSRRSSWLSGPRNDPAAMQADIWLGDSLGEMARYYSLSSVALLGGSFEPLGGQNLIEAAACGCPVIMGPHTFNFAEASLQAEAGGAAFRATSMASALQEAIELLRSPSSLAKASALGLAFAQQHRGAALRTAQALDALLWP
jgi:3-deoxy-D-manno-octulosonic-acid transferase